MRAWQSSNVVRRPLKTHARYAYSAITRRADYDWPGKKRLAVYLGFNLEHFNFGEGLGAALGPKSPEPDVLNYSWRDYGNRIGAWRCLELFDQLKLPAAAILNTALYDYCPEVIEACVKRGDELVGHGHTNSERQSDLSEVDEKKLLEYCKGRIKKESKQDISGWLSPWISESAVTPDLLTETGYRYTLNWCHDDQPVKFATRSGKTLWSIPYPQELNDIPMIVIRQMDGRDFADLIVDNFDRSCGICAARSRTLRNCTLLATKRQSRWKMRACSIKPAPALTRWLYCTMLAWH